MIFIKKRITGLNKQTDAERLPGILFYIQYYFPHKIQDLSFS